MHTAPDSVELPRLAPDGPAPSRVYTPAFTDGLGDRLLTFDASAGASLELLRIRREFSDWPGFETALRTRVDLVSRLHHPSLAVPRSVDWLESGEGLALVSTHAAGHRLSEILRDARGVAFALELIRQVAPLLTLLQQQGPGVAHGILNADRIVVTREGRLILVEHALGSAVESLWLPASRLRTDLGLAVLSTGHPIRLDTRTDVVQLAWLALALLLGRALDPAEYPANVSVRLDEFTNANPSASMRLRPWLERALQLGARPFTSALEAQQAFALLPDDFDIARTAPLGRPEGPRPDVAPMATLAATPRAGAPYETAMPDIPVKAHAPVPFERPVETAPAAAPRAIETSPAPARPAARGRTTLWPWLVAGATVIAITAAGIAVRRVLGAHAVPARLSVLSTDLPAAPVDPHLGDAPPVAAASEGPPAAPAATALPVDPPVRADAPSVRAPVVVAPLRASTDAAGPEVKAARFGGVKIVSPIDLQVFEGATLVGSTAGSIALAEGSHALDVVNDALGYRSHQVVSVKAGQLLTVSISVPNGTVSINARPWADVSIDGTAAGETPIANLAVPIGTHDVVFRHPQFGEQHQTITVKSEGLTRVSATFTP